MTTREIYNFYLENIAPIYLSKTKIVRRDLVEMAYEEIILARDWVFAINTTTITSDSNGDIELPDDFQNLSAVEEGRDSPVWIKGDRVNTYPIIIIPKHNLQRFDFQTGGVEGYYYIDDLTNTLKFYNGYARPNAEFNITYKMKPERLQDDSEPKLIPSQFHKILAYRTALVSFMRNGVQEETQTSRAEIQRIYNNLYMELEKFDNERWRGM